jgi:hypothetical protein
VQPIFGPLNKRSDGTYVFASPIGDGHVPMIALSDLGYFARYTFDHREDTSGKNLEVASELVTWDHLVATFTKVTGKPAIYKRQTLDEWFSNFVNTDLPVANEKTGQGESITWRQNFSSFWRQWRDKIITRDMTWCRSINPDLHTLERWMRETDYQGELQGLLKNREDHDSFSVNKEVISQL